MASTTQGGPTRFISRLRRSGRGHGMAALATLTALVLPLLIFGTHSLAPLAPSHLTVGSPLSGTSPGGSGVTPSVTYPTPIRHVFVVFLENAELSSVQSSGPYEMGLTKNYTNATRYYAPCHPSAPEYLAATSGATWQCGSDSVSSGGYSTNNIGNLAQKAGLSWGGYMESMPKACDSSDSYPYAARHDPFVYYSDLSGSVCKAHVANFTSWDANVSAGTIPAFAFFAPNLKDDGHDTSVSYADSWLKGWLPKYLNDSWFNSSVWFITYDEGSSNNGYGSLYGGHLYFTAVSPYTTGGHQYTNQSTHYDLLSTAEWLLGLGSTGNNDSTTSYPAMKGMFHFTNTTTTKYAVTGRVTALGTGLGISGATVAVASGPSTTTNTSGAYSLSLANGSYSITASAVGLLGLTTTVKVAGGKVTQNFALSAASHGSSTYRITGTVRSWYDNSLLSGATVSLSSNTSQRTGSNGTYWFYEPNGTYSITAWDAGFKPVVQSATVKGSAVTSNFLLPRFYWEVSGTVTAAGHAVSGANVSVTAGPTSSPVWSITGSTGAYAVWLANATYSLQAAAAGYTASTASITVKGPALTQNFALSATNSSGGKAVYRISGSVRYWYNNSLAVGSSVNVVGGSSMIVGANGSYWFYVTNGTYTVHSWHAGMKVVSQSVTISGAAATSNFILPRFYWEVSGAVRNHSSGGVISGASVAVTSGPSSYGQTAVTSSSGSYALWLANGTYGLTVSAKGFTSVTISVTVNGPGPMVNVSMTPALASGGSSGGPSPAGSPAPGVGTIPLVGPMVAAGPARQSR